MSAFFRELSQRSVVKVAIACLVVAWRVLRIAEVSPERHRGAVESLEE